MDLTRNAEALSASAVAHTLGAASIELARALIATALDDAPGTRDIVEQTLITQVRAYVRQHLRDPELTPEAVAAALAISPRHLYRVCARANLRLEQWIIRTRLEHAKPSWPTPAPTTAPSPPPRCDGASRTPPISPGDSTPHTARCPANGAGNV